MKKLPHKPHFWFVRQFHFQYLNSYIRLLVKNHYVVLYLLDYLKESLGLL